MFSRIDTGGWTWGMPALNVHDPNPATGCFRRTAIVVSWCQPTPQFAETFLSKKRQRTGRAWSPASRLTVELKDVFSTIAASDGNCVRRFLAPKTAPLL